MSRDIKFSFKRYEIKYFLSPEQYSSLLCGMKMYMSPDEYGKTSICNIYYDTDDWDLIRRSAEKPVYKEKLRIRSYGVPEENGRVFIEIKKKFSGVVYKRRISSVARIAEKFLQSPIAASNASQIEKEIKWFQLYHRTKPKVFIGYDRIAYIGRDDPDLRITFDTNMRWRDYDLDLRFGDYGKPIIETDKILMEIKIPGVCPMWLARLLSEIGTFPASFSKYGACYANHLIKKDISEKEKEALHSA